MTYFFLLYLLSDFGMTNEVVVVLSTERRRGGGGAGVENKTRSSLLLIMSDPQLHSITPHQVLCNGLSMHRIQISGQEGL